MQDVNRLKIVLVETNEGMPCDVATSWRAHGNRYFVKDRK